MPDLAPVSQRFEASMLEYLAALDAAIAKSEEFARATKDAEDALIQLSASAADAAAVIDAAMGTATGAVHNLRDAFAGAAAAAQGLKGAGADTGLGGAAAQAAVLQRELADISGDLMMQTDLLRGMAVALGVIQRDVADTSADLMMQTGLLRSIRDLLAQSAGAATVFNVQMRAARDATAGMAGTRIFGGWLGALGGIRGALHWIIMGTLEIAATAIPALVAFGAALAGMYPTFGAISDRMQSLVIASGGLSGALQHSVGPLHALSTNMGSLQTAMAPDALIIFGAAINALSSHFSQFSGVAKQAGGVLANFATKLSAELSGKLGNQLSSFFQNAVKYMTQWGQLIGNIGHAFFNAASSMWGVGQALLDVLVKISQVFLAITSNPVGAAFVGIAAGMSAVYRYGLLLMKIWTWIGGAAVVTAIRTVVAEMITAVAATGDWTAALTVLKANLLLLLDSPAVIAIGAIAAGLGIWWLATRRTTDATTQLIAKVQSATPTVSNLEAGIGTLTAALSKNAAQMHNVTSVASGAGHVLGRGGGFAGAAAVAKQNVGALTQALSQQALKLVNLQTALGEASLRTGQVGAGMQAMAVQTAIADSKVQQLSQAIDQYIGLLTGGTNAMSQFQLSLLNIGTVVGGTGSALTQFNGTFNVTAKLFSQTLSQSTAKGAQAWQNFDQIVSGTGPALLDWFRQAATLGAATGQAVSKAALDMAVGMARLAGSNKTAQAQVLGFLRAEGLNFPTWDKMLAAMKQQGAGQADLKKKVDATTIAMSHLSQIAQNTAAVLQTQMTSALASAALKASGYNTDLANMVKAQQQGTASGHNAAYWAQQAGAAYKQAGNLAVTWGNDVSAGAKRADVALQGTYGKAEQLKQLMANLTSHSWTINVDIAQHGGITLPGMPIGTRITTGAKGIDSAPRGVALVGEEGPELMMMKGGETVVPHEHTQALLKLAGGLRGIPGFAAGTGNVGQLEHQLARELAVLVQRLLGGSSISGMSQLTGNLLSTLKQLTADHHIGKAEDSRLTRLIRDDNKKLDTLFRERQKILNRIKAADAYAKNVSQAAQGTASLSTIMGSAGGGPVSSAFLLASMKIDLAGIRKFDADIKKLEKLGLDKALLNQIIQMGPVQGDQVAQALINGPLANIRALNATESQVQQASKNLGHTTANRMFDAGKNAGKGFLSGLKGEEAQLEKEMRHLADTMVGTLRRELGLGGGNGRSRQHHVSAHGPMHVVGQHIIEGVAGGIGSRMPHLDVSLRGAAGHVSSVLGSAAGSGGGGITINVTIPVETKLDSRPIYQAVQTQSLRVNRRNPSNNLTLPRGRGG